MRPNGSSDEEEDIASDQNEPQRIYYTITDLGAIKQDEQGKIVMAYLREVVHANYKYCFKEFSQQNKDHLRHTIRSVHAGYPNPLDMQFTDKWARTRVRDVLGNKRSLLMRNARDDKLRKENGEIEHGMPATREWREAQKQAEGEGSAQYREARRIQQEKYENPHFDSGGHGSWEAEFNDIVGRYPRDHETQIMRHNIELDIIGTIRGCTSWKQT